MRLGLENLLRMVSKCRRPRVKETISEVLAREEQTWATMPHLQFLIRRGLTPRQAYLTFYAHGDIGWDLATSPVPQPLLLGYLLITILINQSPQPLLRTIAFIAASIALFTALVGENIRLRRSPARALNRLIVALRESLDTLRTPSPRVRGTSSA